MRKMWLTILVLLLTFTIPCMPASALNVELDHDMTDTDEGITISIQSNHSAAEYTVVIGSKNRDIPFEVDTVVLDNGSIERKYNLRGVNEEDQYGHWYVIVFNESLEEHAEEEFYLVYTGPELKEHLDGFMLFMLNRQNDFILIVMFFMLGLVAVVTVMALAYREKLRRIQGHNTFWLKLRHFLTMQTMFDPYEKNITDESMNPLERARWKIRAVEHHIKKVFKTRKDYEELVGDFKAIRSILLVLKKQLRNVREQYGPYQELIEKEAKLRAKWSQLIDEMNTEAQAVGIAKKEKTVEHLYQEIRDRRDKPIQITVQSD